MQKTGSVRFFGSMTAAEAAASLPNEPGEHNPKAAVDNMVKQGEVGTPEDEDADDVNSLASVARKAGDAAKRFIHAGVTAFTAPREDLSLDTRELLTPVGTQLERASASIKLESMSHTAIVVTIAVLYFAAILSLVLAIILIALESQRSISLAAAEASFALEGISRTIAVIITLFLLIFFTFRILRFTMKTKQPILPEQALLILFLLLIMITPGFSVYSPYIFWRQYDIALHATLNGSVPINLNNTAFANTTLSQGELFAFFFFTTSTSVNSAKILTAIFTVIVLAFGTVYFGLTIFFFGKPQERRKKKNDIEAGGSSRTTKALDDYLLDDDDDDDVDDEQWLNSRQMVKNCMSTYRKVAATANKPLIVLAVVYLTVFLVLVLVYDYLPSQVPFIGMISVLKICPVSSGTGEWEGMTNCNPSVLGGVPFARAMSITAQFVVEFILAFYMHRLTQRTKMKLKSMPYEQNRAKHLGFRYFNSNKRMTFALIIILSIIVCSVGNSFFDIYQVQFSQETKNLTVIYSPLKQVGVNFFKLGFGPFYLLLSCFLFALAVAYLPPDSAPGARGFCCGGHTVVTERDMDHPAYILREADVLLLRKCRDQAKEKMRRERKRRDRMMQFKASKQRTSRKLMTIKEEEQATEGAGTEITGGGEEETKRDDEEKVNEGSLGQTGTQPSPDPSMNIGVGTETQSAAASIMQPKLSYVERMKARREHGAENSDDEEGRAGSGQRANRTSGHTPTRQKLHHFLEQLQLPTADKFTQQYDKLAALLRPKLESEASRSQFRLIDSESLGIISEQMNANLFCMETEVLLLNFAFMAYSFGSFKDPNPLTTEEKQALLGKDSRYRLISHLENALTDIQCAVFVDSESDKIFVTFRGTSTTKNVWQDIDYLQIPHPGSKDVEPLLTNPDDLIAKSAAMQDPRVHRGFFNAYLSINEAVVKVVSDIIDSRENGCVLFCCGHSLGGALATHFGMEMGIKYPVFESNLKGLQVSTFGSPRVGTFSYVSRHRRVVPTTHRFCIGGDPVPKLPPAQWFADFTKWGYHHVGVEILLDVERVNLLLGPLFIERQIQHGWGGYVPKNHITGSYVLALALWCARVHPTYNPDWWLPVVNHVLKTERIRMKRILELKKELVPSMVDQLNKEGAVVWTDDNRALQNRGCDTSLAADQLPLSGEEEQAEEREKAALSGFRGLPDTDGVEYVETALASCGVLYERRSRAEVLYECGFTSPAKLQRVRVSDFERLNAVAASRQTEGQEKLFDDAFAKLLMRSVSMSRCPDCDFAPLVCPHCMRGKLDKV